MAVTFEKETTTSIPQDKVFKVFVLESDSIIPKIIPNMKVEFVQGNGEPGTIKKTTFGEGGDAKYIKTKVEATDKDNFTHSYSIFEGEPWMAELEKTTFEIKVEASTDGGSIIKSTSKYFPKPGCVCCGSLTITTSKSLIVLNNYTGKFPGKIGGSQVDHLSTKLLRQNFTRCN